LPASFSSPGIPRSSSAATWPTVAIRPANRQPAWRRWPWRRAATWRGRSWPACTRRRRRHSIISIRARRPPSAATSTWVVVRAPDVSGGIRQPALSADQWIYAYITRNRGARLITGDRWRRRFRGRTWFQIRLVMTMEPRPSSILTAAPSSAQALLAHCTLSPQPVLLGRSILKTSGEPELICQGGYFPLLGRRETAPRQSVADPCGGNARYFIHEIPSRLSTRASPTVLALCFLLTK